MKKLFGCIIAALTTLVFGVAAPADAHHLGDHLWLGELQDCQQIAICRDHLEPPTELWLNMWNGNLNGQHPYLRCINMGGRHTAHHPQYGHVCYDVDY